MSFHSWYTKSIDEAQERYAKEDEEKEALNKAKARNEQAENDIHDMNYGAIYGAIDYEAIPYLNSKNQDKEDEDDLFRLDDDGGWVGV